MSLTEVNNAQRVHIGFFGCTNAGKSSLVNAFTGQKMSIVADVSGTTTDPVKKAMELLPLGPVVIIDTPGLDDESELGKLRIKRTEEILAITDIAILVCDAVKGKTATDERLISVFKEKKISYIIVYTKSDLLESIPKATKEEIYVSSVTGENINVLKEKTARLIPEKSSRLHLVDGFVKKGDTVILVTPIDSSAPKGRIILPQQHVIRDILDNGGCALVTGVDELSAVLNNLKTKPAAVITDSQVFGKVAKSVPEDIKLTSFSILMAKMRGVLEYSVEGVSKIKDLTDNSKILIAEGCTHHRQCDDIGSVKIPRWLSEFTGKKLDFEIMPGHEFPESLSGYSLVVHCGGCMLSEKEVLMRMEKAAEENTPFTNYGILIAYINNILKRSIEVFPELYEKL